MLGYLEVGNVTSYTQSLVKYQQRERNMFILDARITEYGMSYFKYGIIFIFDSFNFN